MLEALDSISSTSQTGFGATLVILALRGRSNRKIASSRLSYIKIPEVDVSKQNVMVVWFALSPRPLSPNSFALWCVRQLLWLQSKYLKETTKKKKVYISIYGLLPSGKLTLLGTFWMIKQTLMFSFVNKGRNWFLQSMDVSVLSQVSFQSYPAAHQRLHTRRVEGGRPQRSMWMCHLIAFSGLEQFSQLFQIIILLFYVYKCLPACPCTTCVPDWSKLLQAAPLLGDKMCQPTLSHTWGLSAPVQGSVNRV